MTSNVTVIVNGAKKSKGRSYFSELLWGLAEMEQTASEIQIQDQGNTSVSVTKEWPMTNVQWKKPEWARGTGDRVF